MSNRVKAEGVVTLKVFCQFTTDRTEDDVIREIVSHVLKNKTWTYQDSEFVSVDKDSINFSVEEIKSIY